MHINLPLHLPVLKLTFSSLSLSSVSIYLNNGGWVRVSLINHLSNTADVKVLQGGASKTAGGTLGGLTTRAGEAFGEAGRQGAATWRKTNRCLGGFGM